MDIEGHVDTIDTIDTTDLVIDIEAGDREGHVDGHLEDLQLPIAHDDSVRTSPLDNK